MEVYRLRSTGSLDTATDERCGKVLYRAVLSYLYHLFRLCLGQYIQSFA
jgi:hypothetical protein